MEDNNYYTRANYLYEGVVMNASLSTAGDKDCFFTAYNKNGYANIYVTNNETNPDNEYCVQMWNSDHTKIITSGFVMPGSFIILSTKVEAYRGYYIEIWNISERKCNTNYVVKTQNYIYNMYTLNMVYNDGLDTRWEGYYLHPHFSSLSTYVRTKASETASQFMTDIQGTNFLYYTGHGVDALSEGGGGVLKPSVLNNNNEYLYLQSVYAEKYWFSSPNLSDLPNGALSDLTLAIFQACNSAKDGTRHGNFAEYVQTKGARCTVGWDIYQVPSAVEVWLPLFINEFINEGRTLNESIMKSCRDAWYSHSANYSIGERYVRIYGDGSITREDVSTKY
ncbi:MAG: C25 family cysteine peptidase [Firmicutes bacterium]|nr:C25 family cysteine peptidase [Bacillota bacterium]